MSAWPARRLLRAAAAGGTAAASRAAPRVLTGAHAWGLLGALLLLPACQPNEDSEAPDASAAAPGGSGAATAASGDKGATQLAPSTPSTPEPPLVDDDLALVLDAERALMSDQPERVEAILAPLLERARPPARALFDAAWADYNLQRYGECVARMQRAIGYDPALASGARVLGFSHYKLGAYEEAREAFELIVRERSDDHRAWYGLGQVELTVGRLGSARPAIERSLELSPEYLKARHALARLLHAEGRHGEALEAAQWVVERQPSHDEALYLVSQVLASLGREQESAAASERWRAVYAARDRVGVLQRRVAEGDDGPELFVAMAQEFLAMGDWAEAHRVLRAGLARHPGDPGLRQRILPFLEGQLQGGAQPAGDQQPGADPEAPAR